MPADAHAALDDIRRQAEIAWPVRCERDGGEVPARGLATHIELGRVAAEVPGIVVYTSDGAADLIGKDHEAAADILHPGEVGHDIMRADGEEHLGRGREILRTAAPPSTAMDENEDRCLGAFGAVNVESLDLGRSIREALGLADAGHSQSGAA